MKKLGYLVLADYDQRFEKASWFRDEFELFQPHFKRHGWALEKVVWTQQQDWKQYSALIPKAIWDYFDRPAEFRSFLDQIENLGVPFLNPSRTVRWNMDKVYLRDILGQGLPVLDFEIFEKGTALRLSDLDAFLDQERLLLKPSISGGSKDTALVHRAELSDYQALADKILKESHLLVQPYYSEVEQGEFSFFFFGGEWSHSILKVPAQGDFRAHRFFEAENRPYVPTEEEVSEARRYLSVTPDQCVYARVDLLKVQSEFRLVELELIEPYLYLEVSPRPEDGVERFVEAMVARLG